MQGLDITRLCVIILIGVSGLAETGCRQGTADYRPFAAAEEMVCPDGAQRVEVRESSYPEFYCVGEEGRVGPWLEFDENGRLRKRAEYSHDKMNGSWEAYHPNGLVETRGQMSDDKRTGVWVQYYVNGSLRSEKNYADNQLEGPIKLYYQDGRLMADGGFSAGIEEGKWRVYTPEGKLAKECDLVHGEEKNCVVHEEGFKASTYVYESRELGPL